MTVIYFRPTLAHVHTCNIYEKNDNRILDYSKLYSKLTVDYSRMIMVVMMLVVWKMFVECLKEWCWKCCVGCECVWGGECSVVMRGYDWVWRGRWRGVAEVYRMMNW